MDDPKAFTKPEHLSDDDRTVRALRAAIKTLNEAIEYAGNFGIKVRLADQGPNSTPRFIMTVSKDL